MSDEYSVVSYRGEHREDVLRLHRHLMPRKSGANERYFSWKYEQNPYLATPNMALVFSGPELVAMRGLCGTRWVDPKLGPTTVPSAEDLFVAEEHRNRGLFLMIDKELRRIASAQGFGSIISSSGTPTTQQLQAVAGWEKVVDFDRRFRRTARRGGTGSLSAGWRRLAGRWTRRGAGHFPERPTSATMDRLLSGVTASEVVVSAEPDIATMVELSSDHAEACHQERSAEFYSWRLANPDRRYRFVSWRDPTTRGFVVLAMVPRDHQRLKIVDSGGTESGVVLELVKALTAASDPTYEVLPAALPAVVAHELPRLGFDAAGLGRPAQPAALYVRATSSRLPTLTGPDVRWHVDLIDTMVA